MLIHQSCTSLISISVNHTKYYYSSISYSMENWARTKTRKAQYTIIDTSSNIVEDPSMILVVTRKSLSGLTVYDRNKNMCTYIYHRYPILWNKLNLEILQLWARDDHLSEASYSSLYLFKLICNWICNVMWIPHHRSIL